LLGTSTPDDQVISEGSSGQPAGSNLGTLAVDLIQRGRYQARREFDPDSLRELADSIAAQGVVQPIVVRPIGEGRYEIIAGERRWRASQQAGLNEIPVVIRDVTDQTAMAMGLIENIQRDDLNPLEEATGLHRLLNEFELTHQQIAQAVGKSRTTVTNLLRLLELNEDVKQLVEAGKIEMGHARALLGLQGRPQSDAARDVAHKGLSVRETERLVRRLQGQDRDASEKKKPAREDPDVRRLQDDLSERLGACVKLQQSTGGKGKLVITYNSLDELEGILEHIQ
jgi:ParB family chromosome partitioning protein